MNNITFKSTIRPVNIRQFEQSVSKFGERNCIKYPWTIKESVFSDRVYTRGIEDCSFFGLSDGIKVLGMHICPTMKENANFSRIEKFIEEKMSFMGPDLQGFLLGARNISENDVSKILMNNLVNFFERRNIPYSKLAFGRTCNDVAYESTKDEWLVSTLYAECEEIRKTVSAEDLFKEMYEEIKISPEDEISW